MTRRITVTINDYQRLMGIMEVATLKGKVPQRVRQLFAILSAAKTLAPAGIDERIITMNSRVRLMDLTSKRNTEVALVYPHDAEPRERRISVFSEIGLALLGRKEQEVVSWSVPNGVGLFEIVKVTYQPEAAGDYHL